MKGKVRARKELGVEKNLRELLYSALDELNQDVREATAETQQQEDQYRHILHTDLIYACHVLQPLVDSVLVPELPTDQEASTEALRGTADDNDDIAIWQLEQMTLDGKYLDSIPELYTEDPVERPAMLAEVCQKTPGKITSAPSKKRVLLAAKMQSQTLTQQNAMPQHEQQQQRYCRQFSKLLLLGQFQEVDMRRLQPPPQHEAAPRGTTDTFQKAAGLQMGPGAPTGHSIGLAPCTQVRGPKLDVRILYNPECPDTCPHAVYPAAIPSWSAAAGPAPTGLASSTQLPGGPVQQPLRQSLAQDNEVSPKQMRLGMATSCKVCRASSMRTSGGGIHAHAVETSASVLRHTMKINDATRMQTDFTEAEPDKLKETKSVPVEEEKHELESPPEIKRDVQKTCTHRHSSTCLTHTQAQQLEVRLSRTLKRGDNSDPNQLKLSMGNMAHLEAVITNLKEPATVERCKRCRQCSCNINGKMQSTLESSHSTPSSRKQEPKQTKENGEGQHGVNNLQTEETPTDVPASPQTMNHTSAAATTEAKLKREVASGMKTCQRAESGSHGITSTTMIKFLRMVLHQEDTQACCQHCGHKRPAAAEIGTTSSEKLEPPNNADETNIPEQRRPPRRLKNEAKAPVKEWQGSSSTSLVQYQSLKLQAIDRRQQQFKLAEQEHAVDNTSEEEYEPSLYEETWPRERHRAAAKNETIVTKKMKPVRKPRVDNGGLSLRQQQHTYIQQSAAQGKQVLRPFDGGNKGTARRSRRQSAQPREELEREQTKYSDRPPLQRQPQPETTLHEKLHPGQYNGVTNGTPKNIPRNNAHVYPEKQKYNKTARYYVEHDSSGEDDSHVDELFNKIDTKKKTYNGHVKVLRDQNIPTKFVQCQEIELQMQPSVHSMYDEPLENGFLSTDDDLPQLEPEQYETIANGTVTTAQQQPLQGSRQARQTNVLMDMQFDTLLRNTWQVESTVTPRVTEAKDDAKEQHKHRDHDVALIKEQLEQLKQDERRKSEEMVQLKERMADLQRERRVVPAAGKSTAAARTVEQVLQLVLRAEDEVVTRHSAGRDGDTSHTPALNHTVARHIVHGEEPDSVPADARLSAGRNGDTSHKPALNHTVTRHSAGRNGDTSHKPVLNHTMARHIVHGEEPDPVPRDARLSSDRNGSPSHVQATDDPTMTSLTNNGAGGTSQGHAPIPAEYELSPAASRNGGTNHVAAPISEPASAMEASEPPGDSVLDRTVPSNLHIISCVGEDSLLLGWRTPALPEGSIVAFEIYVNSCLQQRIPSGRRKSALLTDLDLSQAMCITLRAISPDGPLAPASLKYQPAAVTYRSHSSHRLRLSAPQR